MQESVDLVVAFSSCPCAEVVAESTSSEQCQAGPRLSQEPSSSFQVGHSHGIST